MKSTKSEQRVLSTTNSPHQWPSGLCWRKRFCCARVIASAISASVAKYCSACRGSALGNATMFRVELIGNVDLTTPTEKMLLRRSHDEGGSILRGFCGRGFGLRLLAGQMPVS